MPTLDRAEYSTLFGQYGNNSAFSSLHDMLGRRLNARNVFDLALYTSLYQLGNLDGTTCVMPWPNATSLPEFSNRDSVYVCTQPRLQPSNRTLEEGGGGARRALEGYVDDEFPVEGVEGVEVAQEEGEEGGEEEAVVGVGADAASAAGAGAAGAGAAPRRLAEAAGAPHELFEDWDAWGENAGDWDWRHAIARRDARHDAEGAGGEAAAGRAARRADATQRAAVAAAAASGGAVARVRTAPRRRLLYHEFEIPLSPYDFWLDENAEERAGRARRDAARLGGDCRFYHNCTDPLPPRLLLHTFVCRFPNASAIGATPLHTTVTNVTWLQPIMQRQRESGHAEYYTRVYKNFSHTKFDVHCIQPSWPNATGVSCITPEHGIFCPFPDAYRGNASSQLASQGGFAPGAKWSVEAWPESPDGLDYVNETDMRCDAWPIDEVYHRVASAGLLFKLDPNATSRVEPWQQPCDRHVRMALGVHHACTIDTNASLQCDGHNSAGQADAGRQPRRRPLPGDDAAGEDAAGGPLPPDGFVYAELCAGEFHTCALRILDSVNQTVVCWGSNYTSTLDTAYLNGRLQASEGGMAPLRLLCGRRFVCAVTAIAFTTTHALASQQWHGEQAHCTGSALTTTTNMFGEVAAMYSPIVALGAGILSANPYTVIDAGWEHACGIGVYGLLECFGDYPIMPIADKKDLYYDLRIGADHTCVTLRLITGPGDQVRCYSGYSYNQPQLTGGKRDASWLVALLHALPWTRLSPSAGEGHSRMTFGDSVACFKFNSGLVTCGGQPEMSMGGITPPVALQPKRIDLIERGLSFSAVSCAGDAVRNGTSASLGVQFCCGLEQHDLLTCWGHAPQHPSAIPLYPLDDYIMPECTDTNDDATDVSGVGCTLTNGITPRPTANMGCHLFDDNDFTAKEMCCVCGGGFTPIPPNNASVYHVGKRQCVTEERYKRDFGLRLLLDTHPNVSSADATLNLTQPYMCEHVPRRNLVNLTLMLDRWLGANITNMSQVKDVQSWQLSMMLTLQMAAYTDGLSCFNFTEPFAGLHCDAMLRYVNQTVPVVVVPVRSARVESAALGGAPRLANPRLTGAGASLAPAASHFLRCSHHAALTCLAACAPTRYALAR